MFTVTQPVAASAHLTANPSAMRELLSRYKGKLGISYTGR